VIEIVEVAPRDGLQNEPGTIPVATKAELVRRAIAAGAHAVEVASFVHPRAVPQMADAEEVVAALAPHEGVTYSALVVNERGYDRALAAGVRELNTVVLVSETFCQRNQGMTTAEAIATAAQLRARAQADGVRVGITLAAAFGCPFEGEITVARLAAVAAEVAANGADELTLADTIGVAVPRDVTARVAAVAAEAPGVPLRLHLHDTRNTGVANALAGVVAGATRFDASLAGLGGCPFAPAATGNVATEDLAYAFARSGLDVGLNLDALIDGAQWIAGELGREPASALARAGGFPAT
jgi:hydroxymethylglutaryl-CoA lyase